MENINPQNLTLNEYQRRAMTTCMPSCDNIPYMLFNLQGEVGELSSKIAKAIRKGDLCFDHGNAIWAGYTQADSIPDIYREAIKAECGDAIWQIAGVCKVLGFSLGDVAMCNLDKLSSRKQRGVIDGDGDNR